jgi:FAD dependent oxidoreductase
VLLHAHVLRAVRDGGLVRRVASHDHNGDQEACGSAFVDASVECDLAFFAGASTRYSNHGSINLGTLGIRFGGIKPDADLDAQIWTEAIPRARSAGVAPLSKDKCSWCAWRFQATSFAYLTRLEVRDLGKPDCVNRGLAPIVGRPLLL